MKKVLILWLLSLVIAQAQIRIGVINADTTTRPLPYLAALAWKSNNLYVVKPSGNTAKLLQNDGRLWVGDNNRVGVGTKTPTQLFEVAGNAKIGGSLQIGVNAGFISSDGNGLLSARNITPTDLPYLGSTYLPLNGGGSIDGNVIITGNLQVNNISDIKAAIESKSKILISNVEITNFTPSLYSQYDYVFDTYAGKIYKYEYRSPPELPSFSEIGTFATKEEVDVKQNQLNGTGLVRMAGTTVSFDNTNYLSTSTAASTYVTQSTTQNITGIKTFQHNTASYMGYFNNTNSAGKGVKFTNTGIFPAVEVWQDLGSTPGVQLWANGDGDFDGYLRSKYFQMSTGAGAGKIMQSNSTGYGSWIDPISLPISTSTQTALDGKAGLTTNNVFTGTNTFFTPVFANSTSTSTYSKLTGTWSGTGNIATFSLGYESKFGGNTITRTPLSFDYNGWVGIGNNSPTAALDVTGSIKSTSTVSALTLSSSSTTYLATGVGNVGVGTLSPQSKLDVNGDLRVVNGGKFTGQAGSWYASGGQVLVDYASNQGRIQSYDGLTSQNKDLLLQWNGGNIGIGGTPTQKLDVIGSGVVTQRIYSSNNVAQLILEGTTGQIYNANGDLYITNASANKVIRFLNNGTEKMSILENGMLVSQGDFSMNGNYPVISMAGTQSGASNIRLHNYISSISNAGFEIFDQTANASRMVINSNGNTGFGINVPSEKVDVLGNIKYGFSGTGRIGNAFSSTSGWKHSIIGTSTFDGTNYITPSVGSNAISILANDLDGFGFYASSSTGTSYRTTDPTTFESYQRMRIKANGNVGIGTASPEQKLHIDGLVKIKAYTTTEINAFTGMSIGTITMNSTIGLPVFYNGTEWKRFDGSNM